jgi:hypothetical protein
MPQTRLAAAQAEKEAKPTEEGAKEQRTALRFSLGDTDAYDGPLPAPKAHAALLLVFALPSVGLPAPAAVLMTASLACVTGAWRSVKVKPPTETMTHKEAMQFPFIGRRGPPEVCLTYLGLIADCPFSFFLFSLFLAFKYLPKDMLNVVLTLYFVALVRVAPSGEHGARHRCLAPRAQHTACRASWR